MLVQVCFRNLGSYFESINCYSFSKLHFVLTFSEVLGVTHVPSKNDSRDKSTDLELDVQFRHWASQCAEIRQDVVTKISHKTCGMHIFLKTRTKTKQKLFNNVHLHETK